MCYSIYRLGLAARPVAFALLEHKASATLRTVAIIL